jgi:GNAT superfamily N-acetyltransferase
MGTNGHHRDSPGQLRREAEQRRAAIKETAHQLENRLRERTGQIGEAIDRTRNQLGVLDELIHRYRYWFIGGALGIGFALTRGRRAKPPELPPAQSDGVRYVVVDKPHQPKGLLRSLAGGIAALALRHGVNVLTQRLTEAQEQEDVPFGRGRERYGRERDPYVR